MTDATLTGIRELLYLGGSRIYQAPSAVDPRFAKAEQRDRARDGTMFRHRSQPYPGCPELITKLILALKWEAMLAGDIDTVNDLIAWGGPTDVALWRPVTESFLFLDDATAGGTLQRRDASAIVPAALAPDSASTRFAPVCLVNGLPVTITMAAPNAKNRTPWTIDAPGAGSRVFVRYYPLFAVYVAEDQQNFVPNTMMQGQTLTLEEV